jgi:predicted exporter
MTPPLTTLPIPPAVPRVVYWRAWLWSAATLLLLAVFALCVLPTLRFESSILALLPPGETDARGDAGADAALDRFADQIGRNAVWLVGAEDFNRARAAAADFAAVLKASPAFKDVQLEVDAAWPEKAAAALLPYRAGLLSDADRIRLAAGDDAAVLDAARQAAYSPAAFMRRDGIASDPLNLFSDFLNAATPATGALTLRDKVLTAEANGHSWVLVRAVLAANPFTTAEQDAAGPAIAAARIKARAVGADVIGSSLIQHAVAASQLARHEVSLFGGLQFIGLILMLGWVFRSWRLLALSAVTLAIALVAALAVSRLVFPAIHVLTLVFCSNLAGIAIDYAIYFAADQFRAPGRWRAADALHGTGGAITMSMLAAVLSYALLAVAPFPGLRQIALFCCIGLAVAWLGVMAWFPVALRPAPAAFATKLSTCFTQLQGWRGRLPRRGLAVLCGLLALLSIIGLLRVKFVDDVRVLQPDTPDLIAQELQVRGLLGTIADSRFFLVRAADEEHLLETEEALRARIEWVLTGFADQPPEVSFNPAVSPQSPLGGYSAISRSLPSQARQAENHARVLNHALSTNGPFASFLHELGFDDAAIESQRAAARADAKPLTPAYFLDTPAADPVRHLWLGNIAAASGTPIFASVVSLIDVRDADAVAKLAQGLPGVRFVDRVAETSAVLHRYRERALVIVAAAAFGSALLLGLGYGFRAGFLLMSTPVAACIVTLGILGLCGEPVTFFHVVALHLVTGLSMEYAILLRAPKVAAPSTLLAAALAAVLALLAFGLLALSATPFIHGLGLTTAIGVVFGFAFAFAAGRIPQRSNDIPSERSAT